MLCTASWAALRGRDAPGIAGPSGYNLHALKRNLTIEPPHDKTNKMTVRPAKTQTSLGIRPVCSDSSLCAQRTQSFFMQTGKTVQSFCWFFHEVAKLVVFNTSSDFTGHSKIRTPKAFFRKHMSPTMQIWASSRDYGPFRPPHNHSSNAHAQPSSGARCLIFGQTLRLLPYFMCAKSEGSDETEQTRLSIRW